MRTPQSELERRRLNERGRQILQRKAGTAVRPMREDGYVNLLNKYGTTHDNSESYGFEREPLIPDMQLTSLYEGNGLFTKIIDAPAEEALKHGFDLNLKNDELDAFVEEALDDLEWEEKAATAIKWARLYGGAIIVMLIDDGRGLEEPVDWKNVRSIDELRVYERAIVQPDYTSLYMQDYGGKGVGNRVSKFGQPEFYYVSSIYGSFQVHESRCLVFRNGVLPEQTADSTYLFWGMPEYVRIRRALRETITSHTDATKMLERSVQAIYSMKGLAALLTTDDGENAVLKRLQVIDMARGLLNSIAIDSEGENYDFKVAQFSGVKDVIDSTCNMLSALTNIPQTILFGRSPTGENSTGESDMENWYSFVERIQKLMLKRNLRNLLDVIFRAGIASGEIDEEPDYKLKFNPLWSMSDAEQATVNLAKAQTALAKAQATQVYVEMQALDPSEVRAALASDEEYNVEDVATEDEEEDLMKALLGSGQPDTMNELEAVQKSAEEMKAPGGGEQSAGQEVPAQTRLDIPTDVQHPRKDGGPGSGNFGHEGRPGKIGGSAEGETSQIRDDFKKLSDMDKADMLMSNAKLGFQEIASAMSAGTLDSLVDAYVDSVDEARAKIAQKAEDDTKTIGKATSVSKEIRKNNFETLVSFDKDGTERQRVKGGEKEVKISDEGAYATLHNHPGYKDCSFSSGDVQSFIDTEAEKVMYVTSTERLYTLKKAADIDEYVASGTKSPRIVSTELKMFEDQLRNGGISKDEYFKKIDEYLLMNAHNYGLYYTRADTHNDEDSGIPTGVGVLVIADGKILCGTRTEEGTICGPGGHIEAGETPEQAAVREAQEEFGITPKELIPVATLTGMPEQYGVSQVYLCTEFDGQIECDLIEMQRPGFLSMEKAKELMADKSERLFEPFRLSIEALLAELFPNENSDLTAGDKQGRVNDRGDFEESKHPRDKNGQFASGCSGGSSSSQPTGDKKGLSSKEKGKIAKRLVGQKTHDGVEIKSVSAHAFDRIGGRKISVGRIDKMRTQGKVSPGHTEQTRCYDIEGSRMVLDTQSGRVVTIMWRGGKKHG